MEFLKKIHKNVKYKVSNFFEVQYGFATLRDKIFIGEVTDEQKNLVLFNNFWVEKKILKKIIKGSTYKGNESEIKYIIFPYVKKNDRFVPISEEKLKRFFPKAYEYLLFHKDELLKRDREKNTYWYEFGRSQGIKNCNKEKIVVSTLMKENINFHFLDENTYVYSGIFITKKKPEYSWNIITDILNSEEFKKYILIKGKDFSGGYKSITSKLIKDFPIKSIKNNNKITTKKEYARLSLFNYN
jgi:adenine-specific DNA-methyltransferase